MLSETLSFYKTAAETISKLAVGPLWQIITNWWWVVLPFLLIKPFLYLWLWRKVENWLITIYKPLLFEIKIPKEIVKPIRAMEEVMNSIHSVVYHPPNWWEKWIDGQVQTSLSFEIISVGGDIRFFIRVHEAYVEAVRAAIYGQYPDVEITLVDDYTKKVPQDIPNKDWDLWAADYVLLKEDAYPILTYKKFEKEQEPVEEKRVDPVSLLLEALAEMGPGEQFWIQMGASPLTDIESDWIEKGKELRDKLAKRDVEKRSQRKPILFEAAEILIKGKTEEPKKPEIERLIPPEMRMTPGEREIVAAVEEKISKPAFATNIRFIYLGKRDVFRKAKLRLAFTFFGSFYTHNLNALIPFSKTLTKIPKEWFFPINIVHPRRVYLRQRKIFRNYVSRFSPFFPLVRPKSKFMLNIEELASLYHFPSWQVAPVPGVSRIEAKKKAPPELPKE
ncbi:MAG: hypothetical protein ACKKMR_01835 [Candidatus Nealsonbacteria bacterium]